MLTENQKQEIKEIYFKGQYTFLEDIIDIDYILNSDIDNLDDFNELLNDYIQEHEIIYYSEAMTFLINNDPSLNESLEIADEYGYTPKNLNSEILATLLIQKYMHEDAGLFIDAIEHIFND